MKTTFESLVRLLLDVPLPEYGFNSNINQTIYVSLLGRSSLEATHGAQEI